MGCTASSPAATCPASACPAAAGSKCPKSGASLFERLGGSAAVDAAVDIFYQKIMADSQLAPFFEGIDMDRQRKKQANFLTFAFGGSSTYGGKNLFAAHKKLIEEKGLNESHFDLVAGHLVATLRQLKVAEDLVSEVVAIVGPTKNAIFGKEEKTLFEKLGGAAAVEAAVDIFYQKIMADKELAPFFDGIDMKRQRKKQADFLTFAFGGSKTYSGKTLAASHKKLIEEQGLNERHFDLVAGHLVATLRQLGVSEELINEVVAVVGPTKAAIFAKEPTLFEKLGGQPAVDAAVDIFYNKIMADKELAPFFDGIDMKRQRKKQADFLTFAFGGSKTYSGKTLAASHKKLIEEKGLNERHFDLVAGHLVSTLQDLKVAENLINEVVAVVGPTKEAIFGKEPTLFEKLGGAAAVEGAVDIFYQRIMADKQLAPFFEGIDMKRQRKKQGDFLTYAFGGSKTYAGNTLYASHKKLIEEKGLNESHFDLVAGHLVATLRQLGVSEELINEVVAIVGPTKEAIFKEPTLFEKLGGQPAVDAAVDIFYNKIMADKQLAPFFEGIDMQRQRKKQADFMTFAFGGSKTYGGKALYAAHKKLIEEKGLNESHFDLVAGHLVTTLQELGVAEALINDVVAVVLPTKDAIFGGRC
ncbi:hypothetical protein Agub_g5719 [Astrephomene gubernaculifera]|uniref:Uncharacterized protein n=1 Tax=Astrephomene gubernaculifera TaxID=47775 RepID=A0AAD3DMR4_9CHLO|nr:hypothetical protein Agub_g5719 [Astrephomene gubernaculifera]